MKHNIMNKIGLVLLFAVSVAASCTSCKKTKESIAGKGGNATLKITPNHHTAPIDSCTVYLKYNTLDKPASGVQYDESAKCVKVDGKPVATFTSLKQGKYYIYGYGWDPSIPDTVIGGMPYTISEDKVYDINLAVTEGD